ncbi:HNH endonuclease [Rhizobium sp. SYY.PMSO]|uniref:HNH endonuclease n=1 Tax=Rhizobium sp. SYY.PMSO TaxID=3382192 RepID=UPI00398FDB99
MAGSPTREDAEAERHRQRDRVQPWRAWYKTSRWQKLRMSVLVRDLFTCQMKGCGRIEADTSQLVADHKIPHHGDEALFWDENNLQCLCKPCHDKLKQKEERAQARW